jgi:hypothetical protein
MDKVKKNYLSAAIWPGIVLGLLSVIPIVNYVNFICCLWVIAGGVLAALIFKQETGDVKPGEGALSGFFAGLIGAVVQSVGMWILWYFFHENYLAMLYEIFQTAEFDPAAQEMMAKFINNPAIMFFGSLITAIITNSIFATLGGLLGASIFHKKQPDIDSTVESSKSDEIEES